MKAARSPKSPELQPELLEDQPSAPGDDQPLDDDQSELDSLSLAALATTYENSFRSRTNFCAVYFACVTSSFVQNGRDEAPIEQRAASPASQDPRAKSREPRAESR